MHNLLFDKISFVIIFVTHSLAVIKLLCPEKAKLGEGKKSDASFKLLVSDPGKKFFRRQGNII